MVGHLGGGAGGVSGWPGIKQYEGASTYSTSTSPSLMPCLSPSDASLCVLLILNHQSTTDDLKPLLTGYMSENGACLSGSAAKSSQYGPKYGKGGQSSDNCHEHFHWYILLFSPSSPSLSRTACNCPCFLGGRSNLAKGEVVEAKPLNQHTPHTSSAVFSCSNLAACV